MKEGSILIVDDNKELLHGLRLTLRSIFLTVETVDNPELVLRRLEREYFDLILLDMNFKAGANTGNEGLYWLRKILSVNTNYSVIVMTAFGDIELAVESMKTGAIDFIQKEWSEDKICSVIRSGYRLHESKKKIRQLKDKQNHLKESIESSFRSYRGEARTMEPVYNKISRVAATDANILITGENGTGKELLAREIHHLSNRKDDVFITVDLGSITETLFESEMFGHAKGAFTDAKTDKPGRIELASSGTLFLDEIGNLSNGMQVKLLSVIQNKTVCRVGSLSYQPVDFRLITATNSDLHQSVIKGLFREDLFYRINTITIEIPPLRERLEDIEGFASFFLAEFNEKYNKGIRLTSDIIKRFKVYNWPGNIRELKHCIEKGVILASSDRLDINDIFPASDIPGLSSAGSLNLMENERSIIVKAIKLSNGNKTQAAKKLGINRTTLYEKIRKHSLQQL